MENNYRLVGLSKNNSFTLEFLDSDKEIFWANSNMNQETFNKLFDYVDWKYKYIAICSFDSLSEDNIPINCKVIEVIEQEKC